MNSKSNWERERKRAIQRVITYVSSLQFLYNLKSPNNGVEISLLAIISLQET